MDFEDSPPSYEETDPLLRPKYPARNTPSRSPSPVPIRIRQKSRRKPRLWLKLAVVTLSIICMLILGFHVLSQGRTPEKARPTVSIAIIGAGPAGIAAAYTLSQAAKNKNTIVDITVFEKNHAIGGRLRLNATGSGGPLFLWDDESMEGPLQAEDSAGLGLLWQSKVLRKRAGLKQIFATMAEQEVGYFNGEGLLSKTTRPVSETRWNSWLGQICKYGASVWRAQKLPLGTMKAFSEILHARSWADLNLANILSATGVDSAISMSAEERLRINGITQKYVEEIIAPQIMRQLGGQRVSEINDLALSMAMEREDQEELYSGGKVLDVLEEMMVRSGAVTKLNRRVSELEREEVEEGVEKWILASHLEDDDDDKEYLAFDKVIVAAPWDTDTSVPLELKRLRSQFYASLYITFVTSCSELSADHFGIGSGTVPKQILIVPTQEMGDLEAVQEIAHVRNVTRLVDGRPVIERLYRILSSREISNQTIFPLFEDGKDLISWIGRSKIDNAYPLLYPRTAFPPFQLRDGLWHTNAVESIGSSIDLSWLAGENVARLVMDEIE